MGEWFELEGERIEGGWREGGGVFECVYKGTKDTGCVCVHTRAKENLMSQYDEIR